LKLKEAWKCAAKFLSQGTFTNSSSPPEYNEAGRSFFLEGCERTKLGIAPNQSSFFTLHPWPYDIYRPKEWHIFSGL
jgi:hypothetical protein